ncbi:hypothetical protein [Sphingomonas lycopersici]|uniref:Uncharacterized protein n=1 Tax=Sphingomonas lycopersici TaxID=2951807 RepID=A0AA41ZAW9_9SPHN|nr:hypothetical protein [Sphingomonas lycopersici]MCW6536695.1 hypothetical protein [Sphingomonas lycopersici]
MIATTEATAAAAEAEAEAEAAAAPTKAAAAPTAQRRMRAGWPLIQGQGSVGSEAWTSP